MNIHTLFQNELQQRGITYDFDSESGLYAIEFKNGTNRVNLENLQRDLGHDCDTARISHFIDAIVASSNATEIAVSAEQLYWCLEPNDYNERADYRVAVSEQVDRVLVQLSADERLITWVTPAMLDSLGMSDSEAEKKAFANLARALDEATIESQDIDGVQLGFIDTSLPFKSSLILAPNLRKVVGPLIGWPLNAVAPDRGFLYFWDAHHRDFASRVGSVVVREYSQASYPISTEMYEVTDEGIKAVGKFSAEPPTDT